MGEDLSPTSTETPSRRPSLDRHSSGSVNSVTDGHEAAIFTQSQPQPNLPHNLSSKTASSASSSMGSNSTSHKMSQLTYNTQVRHGFDVISKEWMSQLAEGYYTYFADKRHETQGKPHSTDVMDGNDWRVAERHRTIVGALLICLNLGVDPPDVIKTQPCARSEAWEDPQKYADPKKALEKIGMNLQSQYETLSPRMKYKQSLDPTIEEMKRFCVGLRRQAREDRILFHYNGHGVPRPTPSGEIWVFNQHYTQYIPLSVYELQTWLGAPVIYCYDCSGAGNIIKSFNDFVRKRKQLQNEFPTKAYANGTSMGANMAASGHGNGHRANSDVSSLNAGTPTSQPASPFGSGFSRPTSAADLSAGSTYNYDTCLQLGACQADEILPMNPDLPADLFTCCISTPMDTAVKWFLLQNSHGLAFSWLDKSAIRIPGIITDRRTPLGELNWIFTAITDTIAWSTLDPVLFKKLFRQDLIVAAMFRNFLLARRIMRAHNCHPVSSPELPDTSDHPLWDSWDAAINHCLLQVTTPSPTTDRRLFSDFFEQQLTAFEMWLNYQSSDVSKAPEQLPVVLQVLLSQIHRLRALTLLCRYLDLGPEAVKIALNIGFFVYVLKLLQSPAPELRPVLVFIWSRIMAVHRPVQTDLAKDHCYEYFLNILVEPVKNAELTEQGTNANTLAPPNSGDKHNNVVADIPPQRTTTYQPASQNIAVANAVNARPHSSTSSDSGGHGSGCQSTAPAAVPERIEPPFTPAVGPTLPVNAYAEAAAAAAQSPTTKAITTTSSINPGVGNTAKGPPTGDMAMCCFVLAQFAHGMPHAQRLLSSNDLLLTALELNLDAESPLLRQWSILLLAELAPARSIPKILWHLKDPIPEIRAAVLYAFSTYLANGQLTEEDSEMVGRAVVSVTLDGSPLVRYELLVFLSQFILRNESKFLVCAFTTLEEEFAASRYGGDMRSRSPAHGTVCLALWRCLLVLTDDAMSRVKIAAETLVDHVQTILMRTPLSDEVHQMANVLLEPSELRKIGFFGPNEDGPNTMIKGINNSVLNSTNGSVDYGDARRFSVWDDGAQDNAHPSVMDAQQQLMNQHQPMSPAKSFLLSAVHWIVGVDNNYDNSSQPKSVNALKSRRSLASLLPQHTQDGPANGGSSWSRQNSHNPSLSGSEASSARGRPGYADHADGDADAVQATAPSSSQQQANKTSKQKQESNKLRYQSSHPQSASAGATLMNNGRDVILVSQFREFCVEYFREPLLRPTEADEAGSKLYFEKLWRKTRNENIMAETQQQKGLSATGSWGNQTNSLEGVGEPAKKMVFAQFEPHIIAADSTDVVVFDWQKGGKLLNRFHGGRELSDVQFLNEDDIPLVLTASRDGIARVFKNYEDPLSCEIVTSWWLFADLVHHQPHNPLVMVDWQQSRGHLLVGGDARVVRIWDAAREQPIYDMPVRTSAQLTSLTSDKVAGNLVFAGFSDGAIHVYDRRLDKQQSLIRRWKPGSLGLHSRGKGHSSRILNIRMQRGGPREVASGSTDGLVCLWDVRASSPVGQFQAHTKDMRCMDLHEHAPVIATASRVAGVWSTSGRRISTLKGPSASLLSSKVSPVGSVVFHPHQMVLAMSNAEEPAVNVFRCTP